MYVNLFSRRHVINLTKNLKMEFQLFLSPTAVLLYTTLIYLLYIRAWLTKVNMLEHKINQKNILLYLCLLTSSLSSSGFGSAHHRCPDSRNGEPWEGHWLRNGSWGGAETQTRCYGPYSHLCTLLPHRRSHHTSWCHILLRWRQYCNSVLLHYVFECLIFSLELVLVLLPWKRVPI